MEKPPPPKTDDKPAPTQADAFAVFKAFAGEMVKVPKSEIDAREAEYQRQQAVKPKRGPKPESKGK